MGEGESGAESDATAGEDASVRAGRGLGGREGRGPGKGAQGNVGASRASGAGPADGRLWRPRVLPDANACAWPNGGAGGGD